MVRIELDRGFHRSHDVVETVELVIGGAEIEVQVGILRVMADPFQKRFGGLVVLFLLQIREPMHNV